MSFELNLPNRKIESTDRTAWWIAVNSSQRNVMTVKVVEAAGIIVEAAPIIRKFVGQPFCNLEKWMSKLGKLRKVKLEKKEIQMAAASPPAPEDKDDKAPELYRRYRPKNFKDVVGQEDAVKSLAEMGKRGAIPHALLFTGPSGCGKTTIARILRHKLKCSDWDFIEINASDDRGIDMVRDIKARMSMSTLGGGTRVFLVDEAHQMTPQGQDCMLKYLEDTPGHVYFFICTTDPKKLKPTIITRCTEIRCKEITVSDLQNLCIRVAEKEGITLDPSVAEKAALVAEGSARKALVLLHAVLHLPTVEQQISTIESNDPKANSFKIVQLLFKNGTSWKEVRELLSKIDEDAEGIRRQVLGYAKAILLKSDNGKARDVMECFRDNYYDTGMNGLVMSCYDAVKGR